MLEDSMKTRVPASAGTAQAAKRLRTMSKEERKDAEAQIKIYKEIISCHNVKSGKETIGRYCKVFVTIIVEEVKERFALLEHGESSKAFRVFNVRQWSLDEDIDQILNADIKNIEIFSKIFEHVLQGKEYILKEAKIEWKMVLKGFM